MSRPKLYAETYYLRHAVVSLRLMLSGSGLRPEDIYFAHDADAHARPATQEMTVLTIFRVGPAVGDSAIKIELTGSNGNKPLCRAITERDPNWAALHLLVR